MKYFLSILLVAFSTKSNAQGGNKTVELCEYKYPTEINLVADVKSNDAYYKPI